MRHAKHRAKNPHVVALELEGGWSYLRLACGHRVLLAMHHVTPVVQEWSADCPVCEAQAAASANEDCEG